MMKMVLYHIQLLLTIHDSMHAILIEVTLARLSLLIHLLLSTVAVSAPTKILCVCACARARACVHVCVHVCLHACVRVRVCACMRAHVCDSRDAAFVPSGST